MDIGSIRGSSAPHRIRLSSSRFQVAARHRADGTITTTVTARRPAKPDIPDRPLTPGRMWWGRLRAGLIVGLFIMNVAILESIAIAHSEPAEVGIARSVLTIAGLEAVTLGTFWLGIKLTRHFIASWHGAEHMAIVAYMQTGQTDLETIRRQDPIHESCGDRYKFPLLAAMLLYPIVVTHTIPADWIGALSRLGLLAYVILGTITLAVWVEVRWGWSRVKLAVRFSLWLQRHYTIRQPGLAELQTAQQALEALVEAHRTSTA